MITSSEKQCDKEVETSFVHFMQMYTLYVCHRGIAEVKISLPLPSLANPRTAPGPKHLQVFFLQVYNCSVVGKGKCDIEKGALWRKPVKDNCSYLDQSKPDSHFDSQIDRYFLCILIEYIFAAEGNTNVKGRTWPLLCVVLCFLDRDALGNDALGCFS